MSWVMGGWLAGGWLTVGEMWSVDRWGWGGQVESARMAEAMEKVHEINERALEDRREKEAMAGRLQEQTALAKALESRLNEIETSEVSALRRGAEEFAKVSDARARLELRVSQLEGSLQLLSVRGEQVAPRPLLSPFSF